MAGAVFGEPMPIWGSVKTKQQRRTDTYLDPTLDTGVPSARNDIPVPYLIGRRIIENPNCIWNSVPRTTITTVETKTTDTRVFIDFVGKEVAPGTTIVSTSTIDLANLLPENVEGNVTIENIESRVDFALGICLGPGVKLLAVYDENRNKIYDDPEPVNVNDQFPVITWDDREVVNKRSNDMKFYGGSWDQPINPTILAAEGPKKTPAFRGTAYAVFADTVIKEDTIALPYAFDVYRVPDPLGLAGNNRNSQFDVNIATAIYDILTSPWAMLGVSRNFVDDVSFRLAGVRLYGERNFCTVYMTATAQGKSILATLCDQAYGAIRWNAALKKIEFVLFRDNYVIDDLPLFNEDNLEDVTGLQKDHWVMLPQKVQVNFVNRAKWYEKTTAEVGLSRSSDEQGKKTLTLNYETIMRADVAWQVSSREFSRAAAPLLSGDLQANRDGAFILPGDVIALHWPGLYDAKIPFRVVQVKEKGDLLDTTTITVEQAFSPIVATAYGVLEDLAVPANENMEPPNDIDAFVIPLYLARFRKPTFYPPISSFEDNAAYWNFVAKDGALNFVIRHSVPDRSTVVVSGSRAIYGTLVAPMDRMEGYQDGLTDEILIKVGYGLDRLATTPKRPYNFIMIGNEFLAYEEIYRWDEDHFILYGVERGLIDTVAETHSAGDEVIFLDRLNNATSVAYEVNNVDEYFDVYATNGHTVSRFEDGLSFSVASEQRANLPACPQNGMIAATAVNTVPRPAGPQLVAQGQTYYVTWLQRDYLAAEYTAREQERVPDDTTYTIVLRVGAYVAILATNVIGSSQQVTIPNDATTGAGTIEISATNANGNSAFSEFVSINVTP